MKQITLSDGLEGARKGALVSKPVGSGTASQTGDIELRLECRGGASQRIWGKTTQLQSSNERGIAEEQKEKAASLFFPITESK